MNIENVIKLNVKMCLYFLFITWFGGGILEGCIKYLMRCKKEIYL